jgi:hypothetical protein
MSIATVSSKMSTKTVQNCTVPAHFIATACPKNGSGISLVAPDDSAKSVHVSVRPALVFVFLKDPRAKSRGSALDRFHACQSDSQATLLFEEFQPCYRKGAFLRHEFESIFKSDDYGSVDPLLRRISQFLDEFLRRSHRAHFHGLPELKVYHGLLWLLLRCLSQLVDVLKFPIVRTQEPFC